MKKQNDIRAIEFRKNQNPSDFNTLISIMKQFTIKDGDCLNQSDDIKILKEFPEGLIINEVEKIKKVL